MASHYEDLLGWSFIGMRGVMRLPKAAAPGDRAEATAISDRVAASTPGRARSRTARWGRSVVLAAAVMAVLAGCGGSPRSAAGPGPAFPDTPAGAQARWFFQALGRMPIPDAVIRAHFAPAFLAQYPPASINAKLAGAGQLRLVSVTPTRPNLAMFVMSIRGAQRIRVELPVDTHGRIAGVQAQELAAYPVIAPSSQARHPGGGEGGGLPGAAALASQQLQRLRKPLIQMCHQAPCANDQELEVFDQGGAPIFSVGQYGGASVFGDNLRVWAPGSNLLTGTAAVTLSWEPPGKYDRQFKLPGGCTPPAIWESPQGIWKCTSSHEWKTVLRF